MYVKSCDDLHILLFILLGIFLVIQEVTLSCFCIRQQGVLAGFGLDDFTDVGFGLVLVLLLVSARLLFFTVGWLLLGAGRSLLSARVLILCTEGVRKWD